MLMLMLIYDSVCCISHVSIELRRLGTSLFRLFDATRTQLVAHWIIPLHLFQILRVSLVMRCKS